MADHLDAFLASAPPLPGDPIDHAPKMDPRVDITDLYAFQKPGNANKSILVLNVNPLTLADEFRHGALYEVLVDINGDAQADIAFRITFSRKDDGSQTATVRRATGADARERENEGVVVIQNAPVSFGNGAIVTQSGRYKFYAGRRSDPFFFDLGAFLAGLKFTNPGTDFFAKLNVFGIVLEVPNRALGPNPKIGVWARTSIPGGEDDDDSGEGELIPADQMGRPAINTVFNHKADKNLFNETSPDKQRAHFLDIVEDFLEQFYPEATAHNIASILIPDILTFDYSSSAGFLNGRKLTDDVIDAELALVTNGAITTDGVGKHSDYLGHFPFLGIPH